jgi:hypothetical protein
MTAPRSKIESSLAERGRPAMWANEQESAVLSGYSVEGFREALPALEKAGFPRKSPWNGLRHIPSILHFWAGQIDSFKNSDLESTCKNIRDYEDA